MTFLTPTRIPRRIAGSTTADVASYTGPVRELVVDTQAKRLHLQDGVTPGGVPLARQDEIPSPKAALTYPTRAEAIAANIPPVAVAVRLLGYAAAGDGGEAVYARLGTPPSPAKAWHFQSADGAWWRLAETRIDARMLGAKATGAAAEATANRIAIQAAIDYAAELKTVAYLAPAALSYVIDQKLVARSTEMRIEGDGQQSCIQGTTGWSGEYLELGSAGTNPAAGVSGCSITGIAFIAPLSGSATGIRAKNANGRMIKGCWFTDLDTGINATHCYALRLVECTFLRLTVWGFYSDTPAHNLVMDACRAYTVGGTSGSVIRIDGPSGNVVMKHGDYEHCNRIVHLNSPSAFTYTDNYSERCKSSEFVFDGVAKSFVCEGNTFALLLEPDLTSGPAITSTIDNVVGGSFTYNSIYYQNFAFGSNCFDFDAGPNDITSGTIGPVPFKAPTLTNTYIQADGAVSPLGYRRDRTGSVELRGRLGGGASSSGAVAFTLPVGYRPAANLTLPVVLHGGSVGYVTIYFNGQVIPQGITTGQSVYLDGIRFRATG